jgi:hypothetical protein
MGPRIATHDWSSTELGPIELWPQSLKNYVSMIVDNPVAMYIFWGENDLAIYNDGYIALAGKKHPELLGSPTRAGWAEIWSVLEPLIAEVKNGQSLTVIATTLRIF